MKLATILLLALCALPAHAAISGGLRVNTDTTGTNTTSVRVTVSGQTNLNTGALNATNSVKVISLTGDRVAIVHSDNTITNSFITVTWLNALSNIVGNIQDQINNIISGGTNNWMNEGATNSTLAGIGKPWALEVTNSVQVGALGEAGIIELYSTNGSWNTTLTLRTNGTLEAIVNFYDSYADGAAYLFNTFSNLTSGSLARFANQDNTVAEIHHTGYIYSQGLVVDAIFDSGVDYIELDPATDFTIRNGTADILMEFDSTDGSVTFEHDSTNFFTLSGVNSGYLGGGDLFLSDDGTYKAQIATYGAACSDLTTPLTTGTVKGIIRLPHAMTLTEVRASLLTAQTGGSTFTVNVEENGTTVLSTPITIDNGETSSVDAAVPPVISDSALADDAIITFDIDQVGDGTAIGLQVWIIGTIAP